MDKNNPAWLVYQKCVAAFAHERYGSMDVIVQPNVKITGAISGIERQIDVLIDSRFGTDMSKRIIVDAKHRTSKIDINDVEAFEGMIRDCQASRGVLVSTAGYTEGAINRARELIDLNILSFEKAQEYEWVYAPCLTDTCNNGMVLWGSHLLHATQKGMWLTLQTGICDVCNSFHIWCWDCGEHFAIPDEAIIQCSCDYQWCSLIEENEQGEDITNWLVLFEDGASNLVIMDRKPFS